MAEKQVGGLSMRIGLTLDQLQSDFLAAEQTIKQGMAALNRQQNIIKLKMETDISGLDAITDKTKILEVQERSLTQLLEMQRDKLKLATVAYQECAKSKGVNSTAAKQLETAMERERLGVVRLEAQLKSLSAQKVSINTSQLQENISKLNAQSQNIKIKAEIDTSKLKDASSVFERQKVQIAAVTQELELQRQKLVQLRETMYQSAKLNGADSVQTLNIKSNVLQQISEIDKLEVKLKELQNTNVNLQIRADSIKQAEQTINENIARINAKVENIRVKTEIDVSKLGAATSEFDKAKSHVQGLNRELELQKQKLTELQKAFATSVSANGLNNVKTINLQTEIQKQIQAIDQLEAKIKELNNIAPPKTNSLLNGYLNIKGDITGKLNSMTAAFSQLQGATSSADSALTATLGVIGEMPTPIGKAVAALVSIPIVIKGIENSLLDMAKAAIETGDAVYVMSRGMQLSTADMANLSTIAKVTGIDINEVNSVMRRLHMQLTKSDENGLTAMTLKRYGAEITDETGRLKNNLELAQEIGKALRAAEEEGNGASFIDIVGGKFWSGDTVTFFEDLADNAAAAAEVVKNKLANPALAHAVQGNINIMNTQLGQLNATFANALMPVVNEIVPRATERFGELTDVIAANKENIKFLGEAMAVPVRMLNEFTDGVISLSNAIDMAKDKGTTLGKIFESMGEYRDNLAALMNIAPTTALTAIFSPTIGATKAAMEFYRDEIEAYKIESAKNEDEAIAKAEEKQKKTAETLALNKQSLEQQQKLETALSETEQRRLKNAQEAEDIIYKARHSSYENSLYDLERWKAEQLKTIEELQELSQNILGERSEELELEKLSVYELGIAKQIQLEEEKEAKLAEIRQRISAEEKTELENRMIAIEDEKDAWIAAGMEKSEAEKLAQEQLTKYIRDAEKELNENLQSLYNTELENRLNQIEKERQAWIDKCGDEVKATQMAEQAKADAQRSAAMSVLKQQAEEYEAYQKGGYAGLRAYKAIELERQGINSDYLYMTPQQLADFQKANQVADKSMLPNFMTDYDRAEHQQQMQFWQDWRSELSGEIDKENYAIVDGIKVGLSDVLSNVEFSIGKNDTEESHRIRLSADGESYTQTDKNYSYDKNGRLSQEDVVSRRGEMPTISAPTKEYDLTSYAELTQKVQGATAALSELPQVVQSATESFTELPQPVQGVSESLEEFQLPDLGNVTELFSGFEPVIENVTKLFSGFEPVIENVTELFSGFEPVIEDVTELFSGFEPVIEDVTELFSGFGTELSEVTVKIGGFVSALEELLNVNGNTSTQRTPVEVNTTVQIDEAHAWDYSHIQ